MEAAGAATTMSPDIRIISAKHVDVGRVESYPYQFVSSAPDLEDILPPVDSEEPLGAMYSETPEELHQRLMSTDELIARKIAQTEQTIAEQLAQTEQLIAEKKTQAEQTLAQAEQGAAEIGQRAYEEGYATGEKEGRISAESQFKVHLSRLEDNLEALSDAVSLHKSASEEEVLALTTVMAEYLAAQHLNNAPEAIGPLLRSIFEAHPFPLSESAAPGEPALVIFMHPKDLDQIQSSITRDYPGTRLMADTELSRGSLRLETADTVINSTFESRRERLLLLVNRLKEEGRI